MNSQPSDEKTHFAGYCRSYQGQNIPLRSDRNSVLPVRKVCLFSSRLSHRRVPEILWKSCFYPFACCLSELIDTYKIYRAGRQKESRGSCRSILSLRLQMSDQWQSFLLGPDKRSASLILFCPHGQMRQAGTVGKRICSDMNDAIRQGNPL